MDGSVAIFSSVSSVVLCPKPHAYTVTLSPLTSAAASMAVSNSVLLDAASIVWSPSERSSTILVAFSRPALAKRCRTASKPSEIEVLPSAAMLGWLSSANLLAAQGSVVFGMKAAQKEAATPMRKSARELEACFLA